MDKIEELRKDIDNVDISLIKILKHRMELSKKIGEIKSENKIHIYDQNREDKILDSLYNNDIKILKGEQNKDFIKELWNSIMKFSRLNQIN